MIYSVRAFTAVTVATVDHAIVQLWNPDATKRIKVLEVGMFKAGAGTANDSMYLARTSTIGTSATTVTPDADNAWAGDKAPSSAAVLKVAAFSVQPTLLTPPLWGWVSSAAAGAGVIWPTPRGIEIPPGAGLAMVQRQATIWPTSEVYYVFED